MNLEEYKKWGNEVLAPLLSRVNKEGYKPVQDTASKKLTEVLNSRKLTYIGADWKDFSGLIDDILDSTFDLRHSAKKLYEPFAEVEGGHGGSDDYVLIAIEGEATQDELDIIFDLVHNLGAEDEEDILMVEQGGKDDKPTKEV